MSAALDKSLDDIISSNKKKALKSKKLGNKKPANKVGKKVGSVNKKPIVSFKRAAPAPVPKSSTLDLSYATKVVVYGLPKDIKQDAIKVGGVQNVALSYNEKGHFKGIATIIFKSHKSASVAVEKYNGAPIDGGSSKLKLELIVDPTKKPLVSRIAPNEVSSEPKINNGKNGKAKRLKVKAAAKKVAQQQQQQQKQKKAKPAKRAKKTVEELDQEMADYFDN